MADWTDIPNSSLEPDKPIRSIDGVALRDNPVAIAEGSPGAPRVVDAALSTTVTQAGKDWVTARKEDAVGAIGTYAFVRLVGGSGLPENYNAGETVDGSKLEYGNPTDTSGDPPSDYGLPGTWRIMGKQLFQGYDGGTYEYIPNLALRVS